ncbi:uncharacterized protein TNCV_6611 [Trichonephila clavipes]|nr:uncharacterized protein TNCV_6611 [Trichonephila clavipes]
MYGKDAFSVWTKSFSTVVDPNLAAQLTWTTPELAPPLLTTTPHQREDVSALDRFNVHRCPTRLVFSGTGIKLMTRLPWLDTLTTGLPQPRSVAKSPRVAE